MRSAKHKLRSAGWGELEAAQPLLPIRGAKALVSCVVLYCAVSVFVLQGCVVLFAGAGERAEAECSSERTPASSCVEKYHRR